MAEMTVERQSYLDRPLLAALTLDWEKVLWVLLIAAAVITRFYNLGARVISHDESLHTFYSWELYKGKGFAHTPLMHGPLQFHLWALTYALFGANDYTARIMPALCGVALVAMMWALRPWLGKAGALLAGLFMLISPYILYYTRYAREDPFAITWATMMLIALLYYMDRRENKYLYLIAAAMSLLAITKEVAFIYVAVWLVFLGLIYLRDMFTAKWENESYRQGFTFSILAAMLAGLVTAALFVLYERTAPPIKVVNDAVVPPDTVSPYWIATEIMLGITTLILGAAAVFSLLNFRHNLRDYPSVSLIAVMFSLVLPQISALPVKLILDADPLDYSVAGLLKTATIFVPLLLVSIGIGVLWDWKRWLICAGFFYGIFIPFQTTMFTNGNGFWTGMVGSLGYWLAQHGVQRGSQPWYYYLAVQTPVYEFLPAIGAVLAAGFGIWKLWQWRKAAKPESAASDSNEIAGAADSDQFPALLFFGFWTIAAYFAYSWAGEKMPWLTVHMTLPMIPLAGWAFARVVTAVDWQAFRDKLGWAAALLIPLTLYGLLYAFGVALGPTPPFQGNELNQLQATNSFLFALVFAGGGLVGLYFLSRQVPWRQMGLIGGTVVLAGLVFLTARAAFYASYINYDYQTEFINYASGAPGVRTVMAQVQEISERTTDGLGIRVAFDDDVSWPVNWYMRDYPNQVYYGAQPSRETFQDTPLVIAGDNNWAKVEPLLGNRYYKFEYIRMWWPMQEYFNLDGAPSENPADPPQGRARIWHALTDPQYRQALFDIWFYRDYKKYGELTGVDYSLSRWPVSDRMRLYIRKDVAAQIWSLGVGPTALEAAPEDPYVKNKVSLTSEQVWGTAGDQPGQFNSPRAIALGPDGSIYVADTRNNRIQKFDADGVFETSWGGLGKNEDNTAFPGAFNEIWGIAVDNQGNVYASDTWNHRIQKFDGDGKFLKQWGTFGLTEAGLTAMWGPRGVAVDEEGNVYVADTGNKRILVFSSDGDPLSSIGTAGVLDGELDEPTSVAISADGRVFVADTWNQRVQVFAKDGGYLGKWEIVGWYGQSLDNKPYLALDDQGRVFVSDPEGYRVLVFDDGGQFQYTFGDFGAEANTFSLPTGLVAKAGSLFVVDTNNNRVMKFSLPGEGS